MIASAHHLLGSEVLDLASLMAQATPCLIVEETLDVLIGYYIFLGSALPIEDVVNNVLD